MRNELELIEKIEQYLRNELSPADKAAFEQQMTGDPTLQEEVKLQQELMKGIDRAGLKLKVQQAGVRFKLRNNITKWGFIGLGAVVLTAAIIYYVNKSGSDQTYNGTTLPAYNEAGEQQWASADSNITAQLFTIDAGKDTVVETKEGIVLAIPSNGFVDKTGKPVTGKVQLVVKEALNAASIMRAGLSSRSGDRLLESGGMFFTDARQNGQQLSINPAAALDAEIPADTIKPGMQLYQGKRKADGTIDWVNPRPLEHDLLPVDILSLDFYPPHYLDSLRAWGYDNQNKKFTDSLYYAMSAYFTKQPLQEIATEEYLSKPDLYDFGAADSAVGTSDQPMTDSSIVLPDVNWKYGEEGYHLNCGMNPAKIKVIWNTAFRNTLLATREFEQRMPWMHQTHDNRVLDLYVNNLDKSLSDIDSIVAGYLTGYLKKQFLAFAARKDGKVKGFSPAFRKLQTYYERKSQAYAEAIAKTQREFWRKQAALDRIAGQKQFEHNADSTRRIAQNFNEEFEVNLKEAYRQLGYDTTLKFRNTSNVYRVQVIAVGWNNVDRNVYESVLNRTTLDYTDPVTGKKAVIKYLPASFKVEQAGQYDRLYVYLLPDKLTSFMRLEGADGTYSEKLDEIMQYNLVCLGYKGEQTYLYAQDHIAPGDHAGIQLTAISSKELENKLKKAGGKTQAKDIEREQTYFLFERRDQERRKHHEDLQQLRWKLEVFLFPCMRMV